MLRSHTAVDKYIFCLWTNLENLSCLPFLYKVLLLTFIQEEYEDPDVTMATPIAPMSTPQRKPRPPPVTSVPTTHTARKKLPVPEVLAVNS